MHPSPGYIAPWSMGYSALGWNGAANNPLKIKWVYWFSLFAAGRVFKN
jgi:hypothetical protein